MNIALPYVLSGFGVGFLVGMTGVGGGSLMTPLLILFFGIHPGTAVGTDLLYAGTTKVAGTVVHGFNSNIAWRVVGLLAAGSAPATAVTLFILSQVSLDTASTAQLINGVLGFVLLLTGAAVLGRGLLLKYFGERLGRISRGRRNTYTIITGAVLGVLVSISSVGAGALGVTALILLYPEQPTTRIVGSDIAHAVPLTFLAGLGHFFIGSINFALLGSLLVGSIPGVVIGSFGAVRIPDYVLRPVFALVLFLVGGRLLM